MAIISKLFVISLFYNSEVLGSMLTIMALFYFIFGSYLKNITRVFQCYNMQLNYTK
jgi:hypothetical protein